MTVIVSIRLHQADRAVRSLRSALLLGMLTACSAPLVPQRVQAAPASEQPANVGDAKLPATVYHDGGAYDRDLASVASGAGAWIAQRAAQVAQPALVLDVDDTALSNCR